MRDQRPNVIPWPPIIYLGAIAIGVILHYVAPLPWPAGGVRLVLAAVGLCLVCLGLALDITSLLALRRHDTTVMPHKGASKLVRKGPFARSRNPIYVGNTFVVAGLGLLFGIAWLVPLAFVAAYLTQKLAIEREEAHLAARFGDDWKDYAARTPRWLGRTG